MFTDRQPPAAIRKILKEASVEVYVSNTGE